MSRRSQRPAATTLLSVAVAVAVAGWLSEHANADYMLDVAPMSATTRSLAIAMGVAGVAGVGLIGMVQLGPRVGRVQDQGRILVQVPPSRSGGLGATARDGGDTVSDSSGCIDMGALPDDDLDRCELSLHTKETTRLMSTIDVMLECPGDVADIPGCSGAQHYGESPPIPTPIKCAGTVQSCSLSIFEFTSTPPASGVVLSLISATFSLSGTQYVPSNVSFCAFIPTVNKFDSETLILPGASHISCAS